MQQRTQNKNTSCFQRLPLSEPPNGSHVLEEGRAHHPEVARLSRAPVVNQGVIRLVLRVLGEAAQLRHLQKSKNSTVLMEILWDQIYSPTIKLRRLVQLWKKVSFKVVKMSFTTTRNVLCSFSSSDILRNIQNRQMGPIWTGLWKIVSFRYCRQNCVQPQKLWEVLKKCENSGMCYNKPHLL